MDAQSRIQELADRLTAPGTASGEEVGLQIAAYLDGERVVNVCAGVADSTTGRLVDERTLFPAAGLISTLVHVLADRGQLDYGVPVAAYWPEFAAHGKVGITLAHVLTHTAGVPQTPPGVVLEDLADWDGMCARIADLRPLWRPGSATGWHALTFGFILGEVVRRVAQTCWATSRLARCSMRSSRLGCGQARRWGTGLKAGCCRARPEARRRPMLSPECSPRSSGRWTVSALSAPPRPVGSRRPSRPGRTG